MTFYFDLTIHPSLNYSWSLKGYQPKVICKQRQRERKTVFGSYNYETDQMTINFKERGNAKTFKEHLKKVLHDSKITVKLFWYWIM